MRADPGLFQLPPLPHGEAGSLRAVGGFLRERTGWVMGVVLTVVGSFYMAGTVWGDLAAIWRSLIVVGFLALYSLGFAGLGWRLHRTSGAARAGRWLLGVSAALAPIHAMAAGSLWNVGTGIAIASVAGVALLHGLLQARTLPTLLGKDCRGFRGAYLALSMGIGFLPLTSGPQWLILPAAAALWGLWAALCRFRGLPPAVAGLLALVGGLYLYLCPPGPVPHYAPVAALAALGVLYADAALARWRGIHRIHLTGLRGAIALVLAGLAWLLVLPNFQFLPRGYESSLTGLFLAAFFLLAAVTWRRPPLWYGGLAATLLFTLSLPDLARAVVTPLLAAAGTALGYESEPLPLAWYSLTLLPYLLLCQLAERGLLATAWRQREPLARATHSWALGLSALLLVVAHTRPDDLRPALIAIPIYAVLWLRQARVRALAAGTLPWGIGLVWITDLLLHLDIGSGPRALAAAGICALLTPAGRFLADRLGESSLARGSMLVALVAAPVLPLALAGSTSPLLGLAAAGAALWVVGVQIEMESKRSSHVAQAVATSGGLFLLLLATCVQFFDIDHTGWWAMALLGVTWGPVAATRLVQRISATPSGKLERCLGTPARWFGVGLAPLFVVMAIALGPMSHLALLAAAALSITLQTARSPGARIITSLGPWTWLDVSFSSWVVVLLLVLQRFAEPPPAVHLLAVSIAAAGLWLASLAPDRWPAMAGTGRRMGSLLALAGTLAWAGELLRLTFIDRLDWTFAAAGAHVALLAITRRRSLALWLGWLALAMLTVLWAGIPSGAPAAISLGASGLARGLGLPRSGAALHLMVAPFCVWPGSGAQIAIFALAAGLSLGLTVSRDHPRRWYGTLAWLTGLYLLLRLVGPLQDIGPQFDLPLLVVFGIVLEISALLLAHRSRAFVAPLRQAAAALVPLAVLIAFAANGLTSAGLAAGGALFALRYVLRKQPLDLAACLVLLDAAAVLLAVRSGRTEPLAFVGPVGLSALAAAQILRQTLDPRVTAMLRYTAAAAIYLSAFADALTDPTWSLALLLMCLVGMGVGAALRVRAFLYLGAGFAGAALLTELLRFGLTHSHFWALYLTVLGLLVLGAMVVLTLARQPLLLLRDQFFRTVETWD